MQRIIVAVWWAILVAGTCGAETLTLERALELAYDRSPTMLQARHDLEISRRNLQAQRAALRSNFSLLATPLQHSRDRIFTDLVSAYNTQEQTHIGASLSIQQPIELTDGTVSLVETVGWRRASSSFAGSDARQTYNSALQLRLSQPLFTYNRTRLQLRELELALENARLHHAIQRLQIENQVVRQVLQVYLQERRVEIAVEQLKNARERLGIIQSKVDAGIAALEELYQAKLDEANSRASLQDARMTWENQLDELRLALGLPLDIPLDVATDVRKQLVEVNLDRAVQHGLELRMELRQLDISIQNAMHELQRTAAQNEFRGSLELSYGIVGTAASVDEVFDSPTRNQRINLEFNIPLFDWGENEHRKAAVQERIASRKLSAKEERRQIAAGIRQSHRNLRNQELHIEIAERNVQNARLTYEINLERYRNGDLSSKDISFYQTQLSSEQLNEVAALINYRLALLELKIRTLWDFRADAPVTAFE